MQQKKKRIILVVGGYSVVRQLSSSEFKWYQVFRFDEAPQLLLLMSPFTVVGLLVASAFNGTQLPYLFFLSL
jgi:hypothetical protein